MGQRCHKLLEQPLYGNHRTNEKRLKEEDKENKCQRWGDKGISSLQLLTPRYCSTALARKCNSAVKVEDRTKTPAKCNASMQLWSWQAKTSATMPVGGAWGITHLCHGGSRSRAVLCKAIQSGGPGVTSHAYAIMCPQRRHAPALRGRGGSPPTPRHSQHTEGQGPGSRHATKPNSNT